MSKIILEDAAAGYNIAAINRNFDKIADEFQNKVLYRVNPGGEPNMLQSDIDANGHAIYNLPKPVLLSQAARLQDVIDAQYGDGTLTAGAVSFTPYLDVSSTNVQGAIQEIKDDVNAANAAVVFTQPTGTTATRTVVTKLRDFVNLRDFTGIDFTGATDSSVGVQAAIDYASTNKVKLVADGSGSVITIKTIYGKDNLVFDGGGITFRRVNGSTLGSMFDCSTISKFSLSNFTLDGNKVNQTVGGNNLVIFNSYNYVVDNVKSINAKTNAGYGDGIVVTAGQNRSFLERGRIHNCYTATNDGSGIVINKEYNVDVLNNLCKSNGQTGIFVANLVFPPVINVQNNLIISGNRCFDNTSGIIVNGYYVGGTISAPIYGTGTPPSRAVSITDNICNSNRRYGIAFQAAQGIISGNHVHSNGTVYDGGGMLFNGLGSSVIGNTFYDNSFYGIDSGGASGSTISNNTFQFNGLTSGVGPVDINLGAAQDIICQGNIIMQSGTGQATAINVPGIDGDGSKPFPTRSNGVTILNNIISLNTNPISAGIYSSRGAKSVIVKNNLVRGASAGRAYILNSEGIIQLGNVDTFAFANGSFYPTIASASTTVIPDTGELITLSGGVAVNRIETNSSNTYSGKISDVQMTNMGSGYTSAPTVTFTGGGGTGAAGTAELSNAGTIIGVNFTNTGAGYTSAPTVSFTGGGGTGATGVATVGINNFDGRVISIMFTTATTINNGGNLSLKSTLAANGSTVLTLRGAYGSWYEVSRGVAA